MNPPVVSLIRVSGQVIRDWMCREHQEYWQSIPAQKHAKSFLSKLSAKGQMSS
jgi:hypothetical protein